MAAHQAPPSLGFSRQEHWSGLPFPSPMHESEKWKWSRSVMSDSLWSYGLQPTRLLRPWDFPGKSTGVGCHEGPLTIVLQHGEQIHLYPIRTGKHGMLFTWMSLYIIAMKGYLFNKNHQIDFWLTRKNLTKSLKVTSQKSYQCQRQCFSKRYPSVLLKPDFVGFSFYPLIVETLVYLFIHKTCSLLSTLKYPRMSLRWYWDGSWTDFKREAWNLVGKLEIGWEAKFRASTSTAYPAWPSFLAQPQTPESESASETWHFIWLLLFWGEKYSQKGKSVFILSGSFPGLFFSVWNPPKGRIKGNCAGKWCSYVKAFVFNLKPIYSHSFNMTC